MGNFFHGNRKSGVRLVLALALVLPQPKEGPLYINATGTHMPGIQMPENGMDVEAADIDGDKDLDIIIANEFQSNVILINDGAGRFTNQSAARLPNNTQKKHDSEDIAVADFDGDDDLDIIFVSEDDHIHEYYLNDGQGYFTDVSDRLPQSEANAVIAADLNGDKFNDIIIGNAGQDIVLINDGMGKFKDETFDRIPAETNVTQDLELIDIDSDGDLDLIAGNEDGNKLLVNNGSGQFEDQTTTRLPITASMETRKVAFADVDNDKDIDIYFANVQFRPGKNRQDRLYINDGAGNFTDMTETQLPQMMENFIDAKFADLDLDGDPDLVLGSFPNRPVSAHINDGNGKFTDATSEVFPEEILASALAIEVADLNGDGIKDLYICDRGLSDWLLLHVSDSTGGPSGVEGGKDQGMINPRLDLYPNYPNPFVKRTWIEYAVTATTPVEVSIFDAGGRYITTLQRTTAQAGKHRVEWSVNGIAPGRYYCRVKTPGGVRSRALTLLGMETGR